MVLPIILGALALGAGGFGVTKGLEGADALSKAQGKIKRAQEKYERGKRKLDSRVGYVNDEASKYGGLQQEIKEDVFVRVAALIVEIGRKAKVDLYEILEGIEVKIPSVNAGGSHEVKAENVLNGLLTAAGASAVASAATTGAVTMFATAGTGAAISGLSGAAANSAHFSPMSGPMIWFTTMRLQGMLSLRSARIRRSCRPPGIAQRCLCVRSRSACADIMDA